MEEEIQFVIDGTKEAMDNALRHLEKKLANIRAGKASPSMVAGVWWITTEPLHLFLK